MHVCSLATNLGRRRADLELRWQFVNCATEKVAYQADRKVTAEPGQTVRVKRSGIRLHLPPSSIA